MRLRSLPFILGLLMPPAAQAGEQPEVIFDAGVSAALVPDTPLRVDSALIQVQLGEHRVLSATKGAELVLRRPDAARNQYLIEVASGDVSLIDILGNSFDPLPPGTRISGPVPCADPPSTNCAEFLVELPGSLPGQAVTGGKPIEAIGPHQNFQLSGAVMLRQQKYLDSIRIDIRDINSVFSSILRAFGKGQK